MQGNVMLCVKILKLKELSNILSLSVIDNVRQSLNTHFTTT